MLNPLFDIEPLLSEIKSGTQILTPNNRLTSKMLQAWGQHLISEGATVWPQARVSALEHWVDEQWQQLVASAFPGSDSVVLTPAQEKLLWEQVIDSDPNKPPLLNATGLANTAADAHRTLELWNTPKATLNQYPEPGLELLSGWRQSFWQRVKQLNGITASQCLRLLLSAFQEGVVKPVERLLLVDFQTLSPLHRELLSAACHELIDFGWPESQPKNQALVALDDPNQELQQAAYWARQKLESDTNCRVGIIIPDLPSRRQQVERVFREQFEGNYSHPNTPRYTAPFNISTATPLATVPAIASALQLLAINQPNQSLQSYCQVLNSPFWSDWQNELPLRALIETRLRKQAAETISGSNFREHCQRAQEVWPGELAQCTIEFENLRRKAKTKANHRYWSHLFQSQLEALGWPGNREIDSVEFQQLEHWKQLLEQFDGLQLVSPTIDINQALGHLQQLAQTTPFQAETEDSPLQILGLLEGAGLRFDHLWIMATDDRQWPPPPEPNPLLPVKLQQQQRTPRSSAELELQLAQKLLDTYQSRAGDAVFSYSRFDGDTALSPSGLVAHIPSVEMAYPQLAPIPGALELVAQENGPAIDPEQEPVRGGSALLKDQAICPFNAFARWRLGAQQPIEPVSGLSPLERGIILHDVLDKLWAELSDWQTLNNADEEQLNQQVDTISSSLLRRWQHRKPELPQRYFQLEQERLNTLVLRWLTTEKQRQPFVVSAREATVEAEFVGLPLKLRIDRIDTSDGGETILIDYKTGNSTIAGWLGERPNEPQLPLYALLQTQAPAAISFAIINADKQNMVGLAEDQALVAGYKVSSRYAVPADWNELLQQWRENLTTLATSYGNGEADITPYHPQPFYYQSELLPLNRWPEQAQMARAVARQHGEQTP
ncbi:PD-(D/E)XK nuclease family protein [bacterium SCSIO 12696]|nr:PD-(D/E)XK nuclease family protein [bacterium SCSIO 12696]